MTTKTSPFDMSEYLDSPEMITEYLKAAVEDGDPELLRLALGDIAKAQGMTAIAKKAHINRQNLYKAFSENSNPTWETVNKVVHAIGLKLTVEPL
jgi:probable addiction module antidote protein